MTEEDTIRLLESRHDIHAVANPGGLTHDPVYQAAVIESRDELAAARAELVQKVAHNTLELSETDTERARAQQLLAEAVEHYRYYRGRTEDALLNPPPGQPLGPEEFNRRQRLFGRYYEQNPSELVRLSLNKQVEVLDALLSAYQTEAELQNLNHLAHLEATFRPAIDAVQEYHRETHEDLMATETLQQARRAFDRALLAHTRLVESLLTRVDREDDARHFIKRREPAYAARRRAKTSVAQEPEVDSIESEIHADRPVPA